jgi:hypothetical protein
MADQTKKTTKKSTPRTSSPSSAAQKSVVKCRTKVMPTEEQIRMRAYEIYLRRNGAPGDPAADWAQAERELASETC